MRQLAIFVVGTINSLLSPLVLMHLWGWFAVPLGAISIGYWQMFGLSLIASVLSIYVLWQEPDTDSTLLLTCTRCVCFLIAWGCGAALNASGWAA